MSDDEDTVAPADDARTTLGDRLGRLVDRVADAAQGAPDPAAEQREPNDRLNGE